MATLPTSAATAPPILAPTDASLPAGAGRPTPRLHELSHGESFLQVLTQHFHGPWFYLLDEPDSALSFSSCLALIEVLHRLVREDAQVLCTTHSPLLTALPDATILQLDDRGYTPVRWQDLTLLGHWRRYLTDPQSYLRHLLD
jgi:predicted ATPase